MSNPTHWLMFNEARDVVGCHCGFKAADEDEGYGDSVVDHLLEVELVEFRAAMADETVRTSWSRELVLGDIDDWLLSVHEWPARRFNPLRVPLDLIHRGAQW